MCLHCAAVKLYYSCRKMIVPRIVIKGLHRGTYSVDLYFCYILSSQKVLMNVCAEMVTVFL